MGDRQELKRDVEGELDTFDDMLIALVELLEEKGILTNDEWEAKIKKKVVERVELKP